MLLHTRFPLASEECELLLEFETCPSLQELAQRVGRDHSVVARSIKKMAERFPVVEKQAGKWVLTPTGKAFNECTRAALASQLSVLKTQATLRVGTNREFASRVLAVDFPRFQAGFPQTELTLNTYQQGTEEALLQGHIDIGIDCERPQSPDIAYKLVVDESLVAVASKTFIKTYKKEIAARGYRALPHLLCERLHPDKISLANDNQMTLAARFNDIATTRAACVTGIGWALLPAYAVANELQQGLLTQLDQNSFGKSRYGVWWLRSRTHLKPAVEKTVSWLELQKLS